MCIFDGWVALPHTMYGNSIGSQKIGIIMLEVWAMSILSVLVYNICTQSGMERK